MMHTAARFVATTWISVVLVGCDNSSTSYIAPTETADLPASAKATTSMSKKNFGGVIELAKLPPHVGLNVSLALFPVSDAAASAPYNGDPPPDAVTDCPELYNEVDLDTEINQPTRTIPFSIQRPPGHYYLQVRAILYRQQDGKAFAQVEQFFFGRRPLTLIDDLPSVTLPVEWPSIPLSELGVYGTVEPQK